MKYNTIQYNTIQYNTIQYNTIQYNTIQYNTIQNKTTQHNTTQHNTTQHNTTQHNTTQHNTTQSNTHTHIHLPRHVSEELKTRHVVVHVNVLRRPNELEDLFQLRMCSCMYVCMYVYIRANELEDLCGRVHVCMYAYAYMHVCIHDKIEYTA